MQGEINRSFNEPVGTFRQHDKGRHHQQRGGSHSYFGSSSFDQFTSTTIWAAREWAMLLIVNQLTLT